MSQTVHVRYVPAIADHVQVGKGAADSALPRPSLDRVRLRRWLWPGIALALVVVLYLVQSSFATTAELDILRLSRERDTILRNNLQLAAEVADLERPARIRERAGALGLVDTIKSIRLPVPAAVAERDSAPQDGADTTNASLWDQMMGELLHWTERAGR